MGSRRRRSKLMNIDRLVPAPMMDAVMKPHEDLLGRPFQYSATVLCQSPRQTQLLNRHGDKVEETFLGNWYAFFGTAVHDHIERQLANNPRYICEKRIVKFLKPDGYEEDKFRSIGAKFDCYDAETKTLYDHKTTTTYIHGKEMKPEWIIQLNVNAYFLELEGYPVEDLCINAIYVDWRDARVKYDNTDSYPRTPTAEFRVKAWPMKEREAFIKMVLKEHIDAEDVADNDLPACSDEYCWAKPAKYAVYKPGAGKATKLCDTRAEAEVYINDRKLYGYEIEERRASRLRCERYCSINKFCNQYQAYLGVDNGVLENN